MIDADQQRIEEYAAFLRTSGHALKKADSQEEGYRHCAASPCELVLIAEERLEISDRWLAPFLSGNDAAQVVVIAEQCNGALGRLLLQQGVSHYLPRQNALEDLAAVLDHIESRERPSAQLPSPADFNIYGSSPLMLRAFGQLCGYARFDGNVLLSGATGTGKELFARALHKMSARSSGPLVTVDCASLPETLVESLIFGYNKGAFTGANSNKDGLIKLADRGTLFLDEVGEMPMHVQKKFLRVLQERSFLPVGGGKEVCSDFRVVAATNRNLLDMVRDGRFREDLYYRLRILHLELPALNQREDDVLVVARKLLEKLCEKAGQPRKKFSEGVRKLLRLYAWPGNVRELVNVLESTYAAAWDKQVLRLEHLPSYIQDWLNAQRRPAPGRGDADSLFVERRKEATDRRKALGTPDLFHDLGQIFFDSEGRDVGYREARRRVLEHFEKEYLHALSSACSSVNKACSLARLSRPRLYELYRKHNIRGDES